MEKKRLICTIIILAVIVFIATCSLFMLIPDKKYPIIQPTKYTSMEEYKKDKLQESFSNVLDNNQRAFEVTVDENELNEILAVEYMEAGEKGINISKITGFKGEISEGKIRIYADSNVFGIVPSQYTIELIPGIENNRIVFFLSNVKIGQIPLPQKMVLNRIRKSENQDFMVDVDKGNMVLSNNFPKQFAFKSIEIKDKKIILQVGVFIESLEDLMQILGAIFPNGLKDIIDSIPIESLSKEGAELLKDMTLNQVNKIVKEVKAGVINDTIKNITSSENIEKVKEKLKDTTMDSLKSAAYNAVKSLDKNNEGNESGDSALKDKIVDTVTDKLSSESIDKKLDVLKGVLNSVKKK